MSNRREFLELLLAHENETRAYIRSVVRGYQDYEDVFQEVAMALWESFDQYDPDQASFGAWAGGIAVNKVLMHRRKSGRYPQLFSHEAIEALTMAFERQAAARPSVAMEAMEKCVEALPGKSRSLLVLRYEKRLSVEEIGGQTGASHWAIHKALSRARMAIAKCVQRRLEALGVKGHG